MYRSMWYRSERTCLKFWISVFHSFVPHTLALQELILVWGWRKHFMLDILIRISFIFIQDSIKKISNKIPWIVSHPKVSRYFSRLLILNSKSKNTTVPQTSVWDYHSLMEYQLVLNLDYPTYTSSSLEQARLYQATQVVMIKRFVRRIYN